jgi:hypothetical protein
MIDFEWLVGDVVTTRLLPGKWYVTDLNPDDSGRVSIHKGNYDLTALIHPEHLTLVKR